MVLPFGMLLELLVRRPRLFEGVDGKSTLRDFVEVVRERPVYRTLRWASRKLHLGHAGVRSFSARSSPDLAGYLRRGRPRDVAHGGPHALGVSTVELLADRPQLTLLELTDGEPAPPVGRADDGGVHELQHRPLPEGMREDLRPASLLEEEPLEQVGGADHAPMTQREAEMGDARVEVVAEALHDGRQVALVRRNEVVAQDGGERRRRGLAAPARPQRDPRPLAFRRFAAEIPQPVDEASLAERPRKARLDGANQARRAVGDGEQRVGQAAAFEILEERRAARRVLLRAGRQVQEDLATVVGDAPGAEHRLAPQAGVPA